MVFIGAITLTIGAPPGVWLVPRLVVAAKAMLFASGFGVEQAILAEGTPCVPVPATGADAKFTPDIGIATRAIAFVPAANVANTACADPVGGVFM